MTIDLTHPNITSPVYELVKILEFDVDLGDEESFPLRLEIFRSLKENYRFRAHLWTTEFFRIQSTFPQEETQPVCDPSDEEILVDFSFYLANNYHNFTADSLEAALDLIFKDLQNFLNKIID